MKKISLYIFLFNLLLISCNKNENSDYLIFGHFYGECGGEGCVEIFKLEDNQLFEDTKDLYPNSNDYYDGKYKSLSQEQFNSVNDLIDYFPNDLFNESNNVIGQPDAGDWGGLYIECNYNGKRKFWLIDQMKSNVPTKYHNFIDTLNAKIEKINKLQ
jgi:hypothetical protein